MEPRAQTLAFQGGVNALMRGLLRVPLLGRVVGRRIVLVYAVGRKSGRTYRVPLAYTRHGDSLLVGTPFGWGRNLRTGEPVGIRFRGRRELADVRVFTSEAEVCDYYAIMARDNHAFANFNQIGYDDSGEPNAEDLRLSWAGGARAFLLTPRA